jgi:hypothetical protein
MISHIDDIQTFINDYVEYPNFHIRNIFFQQSVFDFSIALERSEKRQDKVQSILKIIESVVSSPFDKAEADSPTQNDESEAVRTIRIVCELCGPRGDERNC